VIFLALFALPALAEPALWVAKSDGGATVHLFGTVHALKSDTNWETNKIDAAFDRSQELWIEADDDPMGVQALVVEQGFDRKHPLSIRLAPADMMRLEAAAHAAGLPGDALDSMQPWFAALTLQARRSREAGYDPANGADQKLKAKAVAAGKPVRAFETAVEQIHFLADLPRATAMKVLLSTLDETDDATNMIRTGIEAWSQGDLTVMDKELNGTTRAYGNLQAVLITNRNQAWADRITAWMKSHQGEIFVAVGAGHLVGHDSVQEALKARGIAVVRE
jgi:uncharacterized protein YbaP (TraB family)